MQAACKHSIYFSLWIGCIIETGLVFWLALVEESRVFALVKGVNREKISFQPCSVFFRLYHSTFPVITW